MNVLFDTQRGEWLDVADLPQKSSIGAEPTFDRPNAGLHREPKDLAPIVGPFEGERCRRCEGSLPGEERQREHRAWHTWDDHNRRVDHPDAGELAYYETVKLHKLDGTVVPLPLPTREALRKHAENFEPKSRSATHTLAHLQKLNRDGVDDVARLYGLAGDDLLRLVHEARQAGKSVSEIAEDYEVPDGTVKQILGRAA